MLNPTAVNQNVALDGRADAERMQIPQKCRSEPEILLQVSALAPLSALGVIRLHFFGKLSNPNSSVADSRTTFTKKQI